MTRLQSVVVAVAAITIAVNSFVPFWLEAVPIGGPGGARRGAGEAPRLVVTRPLGSHPLNAPPPTNRDRPYVRVDYGRLILLHLATLALVVPFFVWRRRHVIEPVDDVSGPPSQGS